MEASARRGDHESGGGGGGGGGAGGGASVAAAVAADDDAQHLMGEMARLRVCAAGDNDADAVGETAADSHAALLASLIEKEPRLATITVEDNAPMLAAGNDSSVVVELDGRGHNCIHCERPLTRSGYFFPQVYKCLDSYLALRGIPMHAVIDMLELVLPLPTRRWGMPVGARHPHADGSHVDVTMDFCCPECVAAHALSMNRAGTSQIVADNRVQALAAGIRGDIVPAAPRSFMDRHGGRLGFPALRSPCAAGVDKPGATGCGGGGGETETESGAASCGAPTAAAHTVQLFDAVFKRVAPAFAVHTVRRTPDNPGTFDSYAAMRTAEEAYQSGALQPTPACRSVSTNIPPPARHSVSTNPPRPARRSASTNPPPSARRSVSTCLKKKQRRMTDYDHDLK